MAPGPGAGGGPEPGPAFVAVDCETTGFDPATDRIIEVGATRFDRSGRAESFESLVDPGRPIPAEITELTGISDADVSGRPAASEVMERLRAFCGGLPVVGQSVDFDLGFLRAAGLELPGEAHDTRDLASVLLPRSPRLSLAALSEHFSVTNARPHRALADAEATRDVFLRLLSELDALPRALLQELGRLAGRAGWPAGRLFEAAQGRGEAGAGSGAGAGPSPAPEPPLEPAGSWRPLAAGELSGLFALAGSDAELLPGYEPREGQQEMAESVRSAFSSGGRLLVESGTGTGKSLAYLLPALAHARRSGERVVVSTHTLNLQEQLAGAELPRAAALVERAEGPAGPGTGPLRWAVLKGRGNYLCLERWAEAREDPAPLDREEARFLAQVARWLPTTGSGDVAELALRRGDRRRWRRLSSEGADCLSRRCPYVREGSCFLLRARQRALASHAVVVNHALLLASARSGEQVVPPFRRLVVDEAHRLEEVATQQYGARLQLRELAELLDPRAPRALASPLEHALRPPGDRPLQPAAPLEGVARDLRRACSDASSLLGPLGEALAGFLSAFSEPSQGGVSQELVAALTPGRRGLSPWEEVEAQALELDVALSVVSRRLTEALLALEQLPPGAIPEQGGVRQALERSQAALAERRETLARTALSAEPGAVTWVAAPDAAGEARPLQTRLELAPLDVGELLARDLYEGLETVVGTSATLATPRAQAGGRAGAPAPEDGGEGADPFSFTANRLGLRGSWESGPETLAIPSPFDYRRSVLALHLESIPDPGAPGYEEAAWGVLADAAEAAGGRALGLFTSHGALRAAARALRPRLAPAGISVLAQGVDGSPDQLLGQLRRQPRTLVLGTAALWEGVDVRGDALELLAMARLPFFVPTDPVHAGRAGQYDDPFWEYALPQAVLRFRQGFGRLIRGPGERGVFLMLDGRLTSRGYGASFLAALPDCELRELAAPAVGPAVASWLGR